MNEKQELRDYLSIVDMKILSLQQDVKNIRSRLTALESPKQPAGVKRSIKPVKQTPTFFEGLQAEEMAWLPEDQLPQQKGI